MTDINDVLRDEGVSDAELWSPGNVAQESISRSRFVAAGLATRFNADAQPIERQPLSASLRRRGTRERFDAIADDAYERAANGSVRDKEFVRDSLEGKPGVRIADGEWNPDASPQFAIMQAFVQRIAGDSPAELDAQS